MYATPVLILAFFAALVVGDSLTEFGSGPMDVVAVFLPVLFLVWAIVEALSARRSRE